MLTTRDVRYAGQKRSECQNPNDLCLLCEKQIIWGRMLEELLKKKGIPAFLDETLGAGLALKVGPMKERVRVYVPYFGLQKSIKINNEYFPESKKA